jgi:hypothetical protein
MHLAYEYGVDKIWIVNVGDLKPMEFPISFFLDYAWDVKKWNQDNLRDYYTQWAREQFGSEHAKEVGDIIRKYSQYAARRKPELLDDNTYNLINYEETERTLETWEELSEKTKRIEEVLPREYSDAFFELVAHPVKAYSNLQWLYGAVSMNRYAYREKNIFANDVADRVKQFYRNDSLLSLQYNNLNNGKWSHMMDQTHIGYSYWQQPNKQVMPVICYVSKDSAVPLALHYDSISLNLNFTANKKSDFIEVQDLISINASNFTNVINSKNIQWKIIADIGKDGDGITTFPVTVPQQKSGGNSPHLEYQFYTYSKDSLKLLTYFSPTLNFHNSPNGLQFAVSIDDEQPQTISLNKEDNNVREWSKWVSDNIIIKTSSHFISKPGKHVLKYWMVDPGIVLQKLVIDFGGLKPSYLGPPETKK